MDLFEDAEDAFEVLADGDSAWAESGLTDAVCQTIEFGDQLLGFGKALVEPAESHFPIHGFRVVAKLVEKPIGLILEAGDGSLDFAVELISAVEFVDGVDDVLRVADEGDGFKGQGLGGYVDDGVGVAGVFVCDTEGESGDGDAGEGRGGSERFTPAGLKGDPAALALPRVSRVGASAGDGGGR